ncbi:MAG TPA: arginine--tRNA ligase [Candidatus Saccharimonadales bacterium]|nr:arginine--tRNA ligase [Candidatus Saccharimonadales bacterium]
MRVIDEALRSAIHELFGLTDVDPQLSRPDEHFGDYTTNIALRLVKQLGQSPQTIADRLSASLQKDLKGIIEHVTVVKPGFINFKLSDKTLFTLAEAVPEKRFIDQQIVVEYSDPNPFKILHAGHLYTSVVGDAIANLFELAGAQVYRVNFGGDVGLHVAKTMYGIIQELGGEHPERLSTVSINQRSAWLSSRYVEGNSAYEAGDPAKAAIVSINHRIYKLHEDDDHQSPLARIYWQCRQWSYDYFADFYNRIGSHFDKYYPESETAPLGVQTVREQLQRGVYAQSDGAIIFKGEPYGLHTRVFINSNGLPTYETKDVGLIMAKWRDYHFDQSIVITANDIVEYMKVVLKSVEQFAPNLAQATTHITHGIVKLTGGVKMSSRLGNGLLATAVLDAAAAANRATTGIDNPGTTLAAVKYAFLKQRIGADIIYDPVSSVSLNGNSGPYLQYAHARARSIMQKSQKTTPKSGGPRQAVLEPEERRLLSKIVQYPDVVEQAVDELLPHYICTYLYELAQLFNHFYEHNQVIGSERQTLRLCLVERYATVLEKGLMVLGIAAPGRL